MPRSSSLPLSELSSAASSSSMSSPLTPPVEIRKRKRARETAQANSTLDAELEEPVLSHAERRKQRKKENKLVGTDLDPVHTPSTEKKAKAGTAPAKETTERAKRQNSVWVGNLSFKTTSEALKQFFDGVGEITRVHMPTKMVSGGPGGGAARKENRGSVRIFSAHRSVLYVTYIYRFAYVDFGTPDAKIVAITMSEQFFGGRKLLIKDGTSLCFQSACSFATKQQEMISLAGQLLKRLKVALTTSRSR
jgi:RNA recognition motif-containing protein